MFLLEVLAFAFGCILYFELIFQYDVSSGLVFFKCMYRNSVVSATFVENVLLFLPPLNCLL